MNRSRWLPLVLLVALTVPASSQRLLIGSWQTRLYESTVTLMIITVDNDGSIHGTLRYDPPQQDGFAGSPFTAQIDNGAFAIRLFNGTRYEDMHWCRDELCGIYHSPDDTATQVDFARPSN